MPIFVTGRASKGNFFLSGFVLDVCLSVCGGGAALMIGKHKGNS